MSVSPGSGGHWSIADLLSGCCGSEARTAARIDTMHLNGLFVYPIKSCAGLAVDAWDLDERGLVGDRSYMVVDERGDFLTQREAPQLATVCPE
ncbi:MAG: hypothetical protein E6Q91_05445, partial [Actinobacteria bacterium]